MASNSRKRKSDDSTELQEDFAAMSSVLPAGDGSSSRVHCAICDVSFTSVSHARSHYEGRRHAKKKKRGDANESEETRKCEVCNVTFTSAFQQDEHLEGRQHGNNIRKMLRHRTTTTPPPPSPRQPSSSNHNHPSTHPTGPQQPASSLLPALPPSPTSNSPNSPPTTHPPPESSSFGSGICKTSASSIDADLSPCSMPTTCLSTFLCTAAQPYPSLFQSPSTSNFPSPTSLTVPSTSEMRALSPPASPTASLATSSSDFVTPPSSPTPRQDLAIVQKDAVVDLAPTTTHEHFSAKLVVDVGQDESATPILASASHSATSVNTIASADRNASSASTPSTELAIDDDDEEEDPHWCKWCNIHYNSRSHRLQHIAGRKHRRKKEFGVIKMITFEEESVDTEDDWPVMFNLNCTICDDKPTFSSSLEYAQHFKTQQHKNQVFLLKQRSSRGTDEEELQEASPKPRKVNKPDQPKSCL